MWMGLFNMLHWFHFLKVTREFESLIITSLVHVYLRWLVALADLGGGGVTEMLFFCLVLRVLQRSHLQEPVAQLN